MAAVVELSLKRAFNNGSWFCRQTQPSDLISTTVVLIVCSFGLLQLKADGILQSEFVLGKSEARDGQAIIDAHFPGGSGTPAYVMVPATKVNETVAVLEADQGVASVSARANNSPSGTVPLGKSATEATAFVFRNATIKEVDGEALLEVTLQDAGDSDAAQQTSVERNFAHRFMHLIIQFA